MAIPFRFRSAPPPDLQYLAAAPTETGSSEINLRSHNTSNRCGACRACCIRLPIPAGDVAPEAKPAGVDCPHLQAKGCAIYPDRPATCVRFRCAWLADTSWPEAHRPDLSGVLCLREEIQEGLPAAVLYELEEGALERPPAAEILRSLQETTALLVTISTSQQRQVLPGKWHTESTGHRLPRPHFLPTIDGGSITDTARPPLRDAS